MAAALLLAASCGHVQKNAAAEPFAAATSSQTGTITSALAETEVIENTNHIFTPYPAIDDLVEANVEVMPDSVSKEVDLGKRYGKAVLMLKKQGDQIVPCFKYKGKTHNIAEECGISSIATMASLAALDLDSDGGPHIVVYHHLRCRTEEVKGIHVCLHHREFVLFGA